MPYDTLMKAVEIDDLVIRIPQEGGRWKVHLIPYQINIMSGFQ
jgi:hypothetical protein